MVSTPALIMLRTTLSTVPIRTFDHSFPAAYKTVAEKVSEVAEKVCAPTSDESTCYYDQDLTKRV